MSCRISKYGPNRLFQVVRLPPEWNVGYQINFFLCAWFLLCFWVGPEGVARDGAVKHLSKCPFFFCFFFTVSCHVWETDSLPPFIVFSFFSLFVISFRPSIHPSLPPITNRSCFCCLVFFSSSTAFKVVKGRLFNVCKEVFPVFEIGLVTGYREYNGKTRSVILLPLLRARLCVCASLSLLPDRPNDGYFSSKLLVCVCSPH